MSFRQFGGIDDNKRITRVKDINADTMGSGYITLRGKPGTWLDHNDNFDYYNFINNGTKNYVVDEKKEYIRFSNIDASTNSTVESFANDGARIYSDTLGENKGQLVLEIQDDHTSHHGHFDKFVIRSISSQNYLVGGPREGQEPDKQLATFQANGNVGINNIEPQYTLDVSGDMRVNNILTSDISVNSNLDVSGTINCNNIITGDVDTSVFNSEVHFRKDISDNTTEQFFSNTRMVTTSGKSNDLDFRAIPKDASGTYFGTIPRGCWNYRLGGTATSLTGEINSIVFSRKDTPKQVFGQVDTTFYTNLDVCGNITSLVKNFRIPHPNKNAAKNYLYHSSVESSNISNLYSGNGKFNNTNKVILNMDIENNMTDGTWVTLNRNPKIFIQNNESFSRCIGKMNNNILTIECETTTNISVDWLVMAERCDPTVISMNGTDGDGHLITERNE